MLPPAEYLKPEDLEEGVSLLTSAFGEDIRSWAEQDLKLTLREDLPYKPHALVVKNEHGEISGIVAFVPEMFAFGFFSIFWLAAKANGTGAGKYLMQEAERIIVKDHLEDAKGSIIITSDIDPIYYENLGYEQRGVTHKNEPFMMKRIQK